MYGTVRYDVGQLFKKLRDDVSNQEIADAFNKVVPSGQYDNNRKKIKKFNQSTSS